MTVDKKPDPKDLANDMMMADVMLRITAIERLLIEKGFFTTEEFAKTTEEIAKNVAKVVLEKASSAKNVDELIANLEAASKQKKGFN
jgi:hypothetical protein